MIKKTIVIGTRGSKLALWQANWAKQTLLSQHSDIEVRLEIIKTKGDKILDVPLAKVGGKGLFVKEIEQALLDDKIDLAIHSMKDMPAEIPEGLKIGAIPEREDPTDVLISKTGKTLEELPLNAVVGTSSLRRGSQIKALRPDITIEPLRGNIDTRLKRAKAGDFDAIVLAASGVKRLGMDENITQYLPTTTLLPAVGQGALCIEIRKNDPDIESIIAPLNHNETEATVTCERAFLHHLEGSCQIPVAAYAELSGNTLTLTGLVADLDGSTVLKEVHSGSKESSREIGIKLADSLIHQGAGDILKQLTET